MLQSPENEALSRSFPFSNLSKHPNVSSDSLPVVTQLASQANTDAVYQSWCDHSGSLKLTPARTHTGTHMHTQSWSILKRRCRVSQSLVVQNPSPWLKLGGLTHWIIQVQQMSLISSAILGLKYHFHDKTIYLGHGSLASSTQKLPNHWSIYLHALGSFSVSLSAPLSPFFALWVYQVIYFSDSHSVGQPLIAGIHVHGLCGWKEDLWP